MSLMYSYDHISGDKCGSPEEPTTKSFEDEIASLDFIDEVEQSASDPGDQTDTAPNPAPPQSSNSRWGVQAAKRRKRRALVDRSDTTTSSDSAEIDVWSPPEDFRSVVAAGATCWPTYQVARRASAESLSQGPGMALVPTSASFTADLEMKLRRSQEQASQKRGLSIKGSCRRQWLLKQVDKRKLDGDTVKDQGSTKETMKKSTFHL